MALKNRLRKLEQRVGKGKGSEDMREIIDLLTEFRHSDLNAYINLASDLSGWPRCNYIGDSLLAVRTEEEMETILCSDSNARMVDVGPLRAFLKRRQEAMDLQ